MKKLIILFICITLFHGCHSRTDFPRVIYIEKQIKLSDFNLETDSIGLMGSVAYTSYRRDGEDYLAVWNSPAWSVDIYNLDLGHITKRLLVDRQGPDGLSEIDALQFHKDKFYLFNARAKRVLMVASDSSISSLNLRNVSFGDKREPNDVFYSITSEFGSTPIIGDEKIYFPIGTQISFESLEYYKNEVVGVYDLDTKQGEAAFGDWDAAYVQEDDYFGTLGEISLSQIEDGVAVSFPVSPRVSLFDSNGNKQREIWLASADFPKLMKGMSRNDDDPQQELELTISQPWFLKKVYLPSKKALIRLEKKRQDLKKSDNSLNSSIFTDWTILVAKASTNYESIETYSLDSRGLYIPFTIPYKNGLLIKKLQDEKESVFEFVYVEIE